MKIKFRNWQLKIGVALLYLGTSLIIFSHKECNYLLTLLQTRGFTGLLYEHFVTYIPPLKIFSDNCSMSCVLSVYFAYIIVLLSPLDSSL